ncbi:MAG: hypothetical protein QXV23_04955 [Candidatus Bathyarchaeia archaeon]
MSEVLEEKLRELREYRIATPKSRIKDDVCFIQPIDREVGPEDVECIDDMFYPHGTVTFRRSREKTEIKDAILCMPRTLVAELTPEIVTTVIDSIYMDAERKCVKRKLT